MNIFICASKHVYHKIPPIHQELERLGHVITLPNSYDNPGREEAMKNVSAEAHAQFKSEMLRLQAEKVMKNDAILVVNEEKHGQQNYIGGATFLEMFKAFELNKKIFLWNPIPEGMLKDELLGMQPIILYQDLS